MNCFLTDVVKNTLASCDYTSCNQICMNYIMNVAYQCPVVFNNDVYKQLWYSLYDICSSNTELAIPMISGH
jgi:hypothetical protein